MSASSAAAGVDGPLQIDPRPVRCRGRRDRSRAAAARIRHAELVDVIGARVAGERRQLRTSPRPRADLRRLARRPAVRRARRADGSPRGRARWPRPASAAAAPVCADGDIARPPSSSRTDGSQSSVSCCFLRDSRDEDVFERRGHAPDAFDGDAGRVAAPTRAAADRSTARRLRAARAPARRTTGHRATPGSRSSTLVARSRSRARSLP